MSSMATITSISAVSEAEFGCGMCDTEAIGVELPLLILLPRAPCCGFQERRVLKKEVSRLIPHGQNWAPQNGSSFTTLQLYYSQAFLQMSRLF